MLNGPPTQLSFNVASLRRDYVITHSTLGKVNKYGLRRVDAIETNKTEPITVEDENAQCKSYFGREI